jgi:hypothetical protein
VGELLEVHLNSAPQPQSAFKKPWRLCCLDRFFEATIGGGLRGVKHKSSLRRQKIALQRTKSPISIGLPQFALDSAPVQE